MFENIIYLDLRRRNCQVEYYITKERFEVDFFVTPLIGEPILLQIAWNTDDKETLARAQRALNIASQELNIPGKIITLEDYLSHHLDFLDEQ